MIHSHYFEKLHVSFLYLFNHFVMFCDDAVDSKISLLFLFLRLLWNGKIMHATLTDLLIAIWVHSVSQRGTSPPCLFFWFRLHLYDFIYWFEINDLLTFWTFLLFSVIDKNTLNFTFTEIFKLLKYSVLTHNV